MLRKTGGFNCSNQVDRNKCLKGLSLDAETAKCSLLLAFRQVRYTTGTTFCQPTGRIWYFCALIITEKHTWLVSAVVSKPCQGCSVLACACFSQISKLRFSFLTSKTIWFKLHLLWWSRVLNFTLEHCWFNNNNNKKKVSVLLFL